MKFKSQIPTLNKAQESTLLSAVKLHKRGDLVNAKKAYLQIYKKHPSYSGLRASIAKVCAELGQYEDALYYSIEDLKNNPTDPAKLTNLAYIQIQLGLITDAEKNITMAIDINPKRIESYFIKGVQDAYKGDMNRINTMIDVGYTGTIDSLEMAKINGKNQLLYFFSI